MKNFYLAVVMAILLPLSIFAKPISSTDAQLNHMDKSIDISTIKITPNDIIDVKVGDFPAPQMAFNVIIPNSEYFWTTIFDGVTPFTYEPKSGTLIYVTTQREMRMTDSVTVASIILYFSKDNGATWTNEKVHTYENAMLFFPSVAVLNPDNATEPIDFKYVITTTPYLPTQEPDGSMVFRGKGSYFVYFYGKLDGVSSWNNIEYNVENFPTGNNPGGGQLWGLTNQRMFAVSSPKGDHFYVYGTLTPETGYQYGAYGLGYVNFTESAEPLSSVPEAWGLNKFRSAPELGSSYNAPFRMDADAEGNVYAFFNNIYPDDENTRIPGYSKSTDNGRTWSEIQKMPFGRVSDYLTTYNHNMAEFGYQPYVFTSWDVAVTGVDEFSMFFRYILAEGATAETALCQGHIVEVSHKAGNWMPIRKVGEFRVEDGFQYFAPLLIRFNTENAPNYVDEITENYRYEELEASKTADGSGIVVKWLTPPATNNIGKLEKVQALYGNFLVTIDEMMVPDIFIATRKLNEMQWKSFNTTEDLWYNKGTYLAKPVPSLTVIPVAEHITQKIVDPNNYRFPYPYFLQNVVGDRRFADANGETRVLYSTVIAAFNSENPQTIKNPVLQYPAGIVGFPATSVLENLPFAIQNISPNPANAVAQLVFNLEVNADVRIDIRNSMGQTFKTLNVTNAHVGENTVSVITNDLPSGAYFYTITVNGKSQTKLLNVVR